MVSAIFGLENSQKPEDIIKVVGCLLEWLADPSQDSLRRTFVVWLKRVALKKFLPHTEFEQIQELQEMHTMLAESIDTWSETIKYEARQEGEGKLLIKMLKHQFGSNFPNWIITRIQKASTTELEDWSIRLLQAQTIDDVFKD